MEYRGFNYSYVSYRDLLWKNDRDNCSGTLTVKAFPYEHSELIKLMFEKDYRGRKADKTKWLKGYVLIHDYFDEEKDLWLCDLIIPINDMLISIEEVIDIIDEIITDVSH